MPDTYKPGVLEGRYLVIALIWAVLCCISAYWNITTEKEKSLQLAQKEALTILDKDQALRFWATDHEGFYVPVTEETPPNTYLSHIPERDIVTPSGKQLTLMNPAYMLRQVMNHYSNLYSANCNITSLKALNPINTPDEWEVKALHTFNNGNNEYAEVQQIEGQQFLRFMRVMYTQPGCLKCHAHQGYNLGDVRGGLSVSVSLAPYREMEKRSIQKLQISHTFFLFSGFGVIFFIYHRSRKRIFEQVDAAKNLREESEKIKLFAYSVAHDLKNPVIAIHGLTKLLKRQYKDTLNDKGLNYCDKITQSAAEIESFVEQINVYISAKEHPLVIEELDFLQLCQTVRNEYTSQLQTRNIHWSNPSQVSIIRADRIALLRIIRNFIDNALKYGGESLSRIEITYQETDDFHTICVLNDGNAIPPDDCQKLFAHFKRSPTDTTVEGAGLGLAIISELVQLHNGETWGWSDGRIGASFYFTISKRL